MDVKDERGLAANRWNHHKANAAGFVERLLRRNVSVLVAAGQVAELRVLDVDFENRRLGALSGHYDDLGRLAHDAARLDGKARGLYITLNALDRSILQRSPNRLTPGAKAACDVDVIRRRWLPIDLDPVRAPATNATESEVAAAVARAEQIWLAARSWGWGEPVACHSGNGVHLLYGIDLDRDDEGLVKCVLRKLSALFDDEQVKVDTTVFNPSRIWKLPGTIAMKGPPSEGRPHRRSVLACWGQSTVSSEKLERFVERRPGSRSSRSHRDRQQTRMVRGNPTIERLAAEILQAAPGSRHSTLYRSAARAGGLVRAGRLSAGEAFDRLFDAGQVAYGGQRPAARIARVIRDAMVRRSWRGGAA